MIFFGKLYLITILGLKVRRIAVKKGILSVVLLNQALMGDAIADPTSPQFRLAVAVLAGLILLSSGACLLFQHHHPDKTARV